MKFDTSEPSSEEFFALRHDYDAVILCLKGLLRLFDTGVLTKDEIVDELRIQLASALDRRQKFW